jgi:5-methylcytosine-specific restriction endonuclease McrA
MRLRGNPCAAGPTTYANIAACAKSSELSHHIEHIIAKQHGGSDDSENLALACHRCNVRGGPNLTGIDPRRGKSPAFFIHGAIDGPRRGGARPS